jgi:outer membrane protein TolC
MIQTAGGEMDGSIGISQGIPLPAKLKSRGKIAEQVVRVALENLRSERLKVVAEVKQAYFAFYLAHASIEVTNENLQLLMRMREVAEAKYSAGTAPQQDLLRAEVELYSASNHLITLEQGRQTAIARLNILMDRDVLAGLPDPPALTPSGIGSRVESLLERAVAANPELAAWQEQTRADLEAIRLAKLAAWPDFDLGAMLSFISSSGLSAVANGDDAWNLQFGMTLPVWRARIRAGVLERNALVLASTEHYRGARNEVFFAIQDLFVKVDAAHRSATLLRGGILPRARQTVEVSESGYQAGEVSFMALIDNWQRLLDLTLDYHRALATLEQEVAALEQVLGGAIERTAPEE